MRLIGLAMILASSLVAASLAAEAQSTRIPRIGNASPPPVLSELPFHRGLRELGWIEVGQVSSRRRGAAARDGFHIGRQLIEALSREHDGPSGQSGLAPVAPARKGAPGLEVKKAGKCIASSPTALSRAAVVTVSSTEIGSFIEVGAGRVWRIGASRAITAHR